jgi:hypothetical protein
MNDTERAQWIDNDEGLYNWYRGWRREQHRSRKAQRIFIKEHRAEIDAAINRVLTPKPKTWRD